MSTFSLFWNSLKLQNKFLFQINWNNIRNVSKDWLKRSYTGKKIKGVNASPNFKNKNTRNAMNWWLKDWVCNALSKGFHFFLCRSNKCQQKKGFKYKHLCCCKIAQVCVVNLLICCKVACVLQSYLCVVKLYVCYKVTYMCYKVTYVL